MSIETAHLFVNDYHNIDRSYMALSSPLFSSLLRSPDGMKFPNGDSAQASGLWVAAKRPVSSVLSIMESDSLVIRPGRHPQAVARSPEPEAGCVAPNARASRSTMPALDARRAAIGTADRSRRCARRTDHAADVSEDLREGLVRGRLGRVRSTAAIALDARLQQRANWRATRPG